jgi:hypothetical protein
METNYGEGLEVIGPEKWKTETITEAVKENSFVGSRYQAKEQWRNNSCSFFLDCLEQRE